MSQRVVLDTLVQASPAQAFQVFGDFHHAADNVGGIQALEVLTQGPIGRGTRFRETRIMFGKLCSEEMEVSEWVPGERYAVCAESCGAQYLSTFSFHPEGEATRVEMVVESTPVSLMAKLMRPLGFLMTGSMKKLMAQDMADLKAKVEAGA